MTSSKKKAPKKAKAPRNSTATVADNLERFKATKARVDAMRADLDGIVAEYKSFGKDDMVFACALSALSHVIRTGYCLSVEIRAAEKALTAPKEFTWNVECGHYKKGKGGKWVSLEIPPAKGKRAAKRRTP